MLGFWKIKVNAIIVADEVDGVVAKIIKGRLLTHQKDVFRFDSIICELFGNSFPPRTFQANTINVTSMWLEADEVLLYTEDALPKIGDDLLADGLFACSQAKG